MFKFKANLVQLNSGVWSHCFFVPNTVSREILESGSKRVICTINQQAKYHSALMPKGNHEYFINVKKEIRAKLDIDLNSVLDISLELDTSKYGLPVPEELVQAWNLDEEGKAIFHSLTPGKQRNLLHLIGLPKSSELRIKKALVVLSYLKSVNGKLNFKELNLALKQANE
jgi:hypothetical protein